MSGRSFLRKVLFLAIIFSCTAGDDQEAISAEELSKTPQSFFWINTDKVHSKASFFLSALQHYQNEGFNPERYNYSDLIKELSYVNPNKDIILKVLSKSFLEFISDLTKGQVDPKTLGSCWERADTTDNINPREVLERFLFDDSFNFDSLEPQNERFRTLRSELFKYEKIRKSGGWEQITSNVLPEQLAQRLRIGGDLEEPLSSDTINKALMKFQTRHGLKPDGVLGKETIVAMNISVEFRIEQIKLNLERWRWLSRNLEQKYAEVNIPDYQLRIYEDADLTLQMRVIVGKPTWPTPVLRSDIFAIEINPNWDVPLSITRREILPLLKKDAQYLTNNQMIVLTAQGLPITPPSDWNLYNANNFPYKLRQLPGPGNSVGPIKFKFANHYGVFLHGTPAKNLFGKERRGFSHGCVRIENPLEFANLAFLRNALSKAEIEDSLKSGETRLLRLPQILPLYLSYWTAWVDKDSLLHFANDIYGGDAKLSRALQHYHQRAGQPRTST